MFCTSCGTKNVADSNFCKQCGSKVEKLLSSRINSEDFERALPDEEQMSVLLEHAYTLRKEGNYDGAIALCVEALHLPMESTSAHSLLGQIYEEKGERVAAIREYERVLVLNPGSIADRVKLDELRSETTTEPRKTHPHITLSDHRKAPVFDTGRYTSIGVTVALVLLGGLIVLQFRPRSERTVPGNALSGTSTDLNSTAPASSAANRLKASGALTSGTAIGTQQTNQPPAGTTAVQQIASSFPPSASSQPSPPLNSAPLPANYAPPLYRSVPEIRNVPVSGPSPTQNTNSAYLTNKASGKRVPRGANDSGKAPRIMLSSDTDAADGNSKITVPIGDTDFPGTGSSKNNATKNADKTSGKNNEGDTPGNHIEVDRSHPNNPRTAPGIPTGEARTLIAVGEEKKNQHDYKGAIDAYTRSLASAGDQTGFVLQQRALCFQNLNDMTSAKSDFEHAIIEYHKLEISDPETARNGIRACERGVKTL